MNDTGVYLSRPKSLVGDKWARDSAVGRKQRLNLNKIDNEPRDKIILDNELAI